MAISSSKYVGVLSAANTASIGLVSFSNAGLVISGSEITATTEDVELAKKKTSYNGGDIVGFNSIDEVKTLFGPYSQEGYFATGYFSYIAPNGLFPEILYLKRYNSNSLVAEARKVFDSPTDFGSFTFLSVPDGSSVDDSNDLKDVAVFNSSSETRKMFVINWKKEDGGETEITDLTDFVKNNLSGLRGCCVVYGATDWSAFMPMAVLAAQNIATSGVLQFMFNRFTQPTDNDVPTVTSDELYNTLSENNINFLGRTQVNGQRLDFFQRGYATNGEDLTLQMAMNWIEQQTRGAIMNLFVTSVMPASNTSVLAIEGAIGTVMRSARDSGIVVPMESISDTIHRDIIREIVNDMGGSLDVVNQIEADLTISGFGYYVKLNGIRNLGNISGGRDEPYISYKVLYSYAGAIRFVSGEYKVVQA
ncbi:MAG: DUF3383 family protein [Prevotella sp.]|nr:DUF3383 family protein [Prevotella sp.]